MASSRPMYLHVAMMVFGALLLDVRSVSAQGEPPSGAEEAPSAEEAPDPEAQARALYDAGELAYSEGRFDASLAFFQEAYELSHRAELLYNVGIAATNAGDERIALAAFETYLRELPDAPNRALVEGRMQGLRDEIAEEEEIIRLSALERASIERERASGANAVRSAGVALAITGSVLAVAGGVLLGVGYADVANVEGAAVDTPWLSLRDAYERAPISTGVGYGAGGLGLALLGAGLGLALGTPDPEAPVVAVGLGTVSLRGRF